MIWSVPRANARPKFLCYVGKEQFIAHEERISKIVNFVLVEKGCG